MPGSIATEMDARDAFSRQAPVFDAIDQGNAIIAHMRGIVRKEALRGMKPGDTLLELNAGTGIDSLWFAEHGLRILATDAAPGMIAQMNAKRAMHPKLPVDVMECSFLELHRLGDRRFDHVFSNFGGLNCTSHLNEVLNAINGLLKPGGTCTLVIMPLFSPWETFAFLKGHFKIAFRRWRHGGSTAYVEGVPFLCYYYNPAYVRKHMGETYEVVHQRALSLFVPPPHMEGFLERWPRLFRLLRTLEERVAHLWPFRNWGDHFLIVLHRKA